MKRNKPHQSGFQGRHHFEEDQPGFVADKTVNQKPGLRGVEEWNMQEE